MMLTSSRWEVKPLAALRCVKLLVPGWRRRSPKTVIEKGSPRSKQLNVSISAEPRPQEIGTRLQCVRLPLKATHHRASPSTGATSQVGKVDPVPASSLNVIYHRSLLTQL